MTDRPLGSRYLLVEQIGRGATGTVWRAVARDTGEAVAVKLLREDLAAESEVLARFVQERSLLLRLRHENLVRVHDMVIEGGDLALVMDLVDGTDLREYLRRHGTLTPAHAATLLAEVAEALTTVHAHGVVHRDLKPDNILLEHRPRGGRRVRLTDFGVARVLGGPGITTASAVVGTPNYLAPEIIDSQPPTPAADVYALGVVLYELLVGRAPYAGGHPLTILRRHLDAVPRRRPGIPDPVWSLVEDCVARDPRRRPGSVELAGRLRAVARQAATAPALRPLPKEAEPLATHVLVEGRAGTGELPAILGGPVRGPGPRRGPRHRRVTWAGSPARARRWQRLAGGAAAGLVAAALLVPLFGGLPHRDQAAAGGEAADVLPGPVGPLPAVPVSPSAVSPTPRPHASRPPRVVTKVAPLPRVTVTTVLRQQVPVTLAPVRPSPPPAAPVKRLTPSPARPVLPTARPDLAWVCSTGSEWSARGKVAVKPCHAAAPGVVRVQSQFTGRKGVKLDASVWLRDTADGDRVAGPFHCRDLRITRGEQTRTCGPFSAEVAPRGRYLVMVRWRERHGGDAGVTVSDTFDR